MILRMRLLRCLATAYVCLPVTIFLLGWTRSVIGLSALLLMGVVLLAMRTRDAFAYRMPQGAFDGETLSVPFPELLLIVLAIVAWCVICGQGGFVCQKGDWAARNAIFRDLITHSWPVMYPQVNGALSYYVGFGLPAAVVGKFVLSVSGSVEMAWAIANVCLLIWTVVAIFRISADLCNLAGFPFVSG